MQEIPNQPQTGFAGNRHVLLVGGAGYIGSVLCRRLLSEGYKVRVLDLLVYGNGTSISGLLENPNFSFVRGDFCDAGLLKRVLTGASDVVLLAALVGEPICKKYPELARKVNMDGTVRLFDILSNRSIGKFIFFSTCSNYGLRVSDDLATEEADLSPQSLYAEAKVTAEQYILANKDKVDFSPTILRLATAYGISNRMRFDLTVSEFTRELVLKKELLVYDEHTWRPYCHVSDIADIVLRVLQAPPEKVCGEVFNAGTTEENYTKKMIVDSITPYVGPCRITYKKGGHDPRNYRVSFEKAARVLGFKNRFTMPIGVQNLITALEAGIFDDVDTRKTYYGNYHIDGA
jgi:nucleoside-diphosphate-sugar epimerase